VARGLTVLVRDLMGLDPYPLSGSVYVFCNKSRMLLKAVWWGKTGFWLAQKRLEEAKFPWPRDRGEAEEPDPAQARILLLMLRKPISHDPHM
jgi:transposase